jgi:hypothetical protein
MWWGSGLEGENATPQQILGTSKQSSAAKFAENFVG